MTFLLWTDGASSAVLRSSCPSCYMAAYLVHRSPQAQTARRRPATHWDQGEPRVGAGLGQRRVHRRRMALLDHGPRYSLTDRVGTEAGGPCQIGQLLDNPQ